MKNTNPSTDDPSVVTDGADDSAAAAGLDRSPEAEEESAAEAGLSGELDHLQGEFAALNDRHLRLAAEFSNYRRRADGEMTEAWGRAQADLLRRFLDVLDDLQRVSALDPSNEAVSVQSVVDGIDLVERKFQRALDEAKVDVIDPAPGSTFDPGTMEAVLRVPASSSDQDDTVDQVFQRGYRFRSHLVRPARVSVRKHE
ncbi:MAG: nucleotide exchange factor GrpE [Gemmatimonadetes bacterium]|nr:nucleotide exchange factor GrpE [Gemmatimonadota bacterium]